MLVLLLIIAWAVVLLPPLVQRLLVHRPAGSSSSDALGALARRQSHLTEGTAPRTADASPHRPDGDYMPRSAAQAESRRRLTVLVLGAAAAITLLAVVAVGPVMIIPHLLVDAALIGFGYLWWQRHAAVDADTASVVALSSLRPAVRPRPAMIPSRRAG